MKPRWRPGKKVDTTCPQWILDGVKKFHLLAISKTEQPPNTQPLPGGNGKESHNGKETTYNATKPG